MKFAVQGVIDLGTEKRKFVKEVDAPNERVAKEVAFKLLGSAHGAKRTRIVISGVAKVES
jgi:ribosomal protein L20A (L18A)